MENAGHLGLDVPHAISSLRRHLNWLGQNVPGWPQHRLAPPPRPDVFVRPDQDFDPAFLADLHDYRRCLEKPDPFDPVISRRYASKTLHHFIGNLKRAASVS